MRYRRITSVFLTLLTLLWVTQPAQAAQSRVALRAAEVLLPPLGQFASDTARLTVNCAKGSYYYVGLLNVFQGDAVAWNDDPQDVFTPCGAEFVREINVFCCEGDDVLEEGKASMRVEIALCAEPTRDSCEAGNEYWKRVKVRQT